MSHVHYLSKLRPHKYFDTLRQVRDLITREFPSATVIAGTGVSGTMIVPALAAMMRKQWAIVRKGATHSNYAIEISAALADDKIIIVDDLVDTGASIRRVASKMRQRYKAIGLSGVKVIGAVLYDNWGGTPVRNVKFPVISI